MARVLVVDDELSIVEVLRTLLSREGYDVTVTGNAAEALEFIRAEKFSLMISDIRMKPIDGMELLTQAKEIQPSMGVIMMTAYAAIESAVECMKAGAYDYICKPFKIDELLLTVERALQYYDVFKENQHLKEALRTKYHFDNLVGDSSAMQSVYSMIEKVARTETTVLIRGESGTGKELVSKAIHFASPRVNEPFVAINCAALPETLLESELFGYMKGAFTGATTNKKGLFEAANGGTVFLDEIGSIPINMQLKLLRVLQEKMIRRVGDVKDSNINVRIIAATNEDLEKKTETGEFREDLYYRLSVIPIELPCLKDRSDDIPLLVHHFLKTFRDQEKRAVQIEPSAMEVLCRYNWPGNVRELENVINRACTLCDNDIVKNTDFPPRILENVGDMPEAKSEDFRGLSLKNFLRDKEKEYIKQVLRIVEGDKEKAADMLGISLATFYRKYDE